MGALKKTDHKEEGHSTQKFKSTSIRTCRNVETRKGRNNNNNACANIILHVAVGQLASKWLRQQQHYKFAMKDVVKALGSSNLPIIASLMPDQYLETPTNQVNSWKDIALISYEINFNNLIQIIH